MKKGTEFRQSRERLGECIIIKEREREKERKRGRERIRK